MAAASQVCRVPLAHIHGGESTEGAIDEAFRHSITKMSHLHFASCEAYRPRIIQLGENQDRVFNVGALGVENIRRMSLMGRSELAASIGFNLEKPYFLVTFHPVTLEKDTTEGQFQALLNALDAFPEYNVIFTKANADTAGRVINRLIDDYAEKRPECCIAVTSLGVLRYLSAMKYATAVIGNSSSGIIETSSFELPVVNIGDRQKGRIRAKNVIEVPLCLHADIAQAIRRASSLDFRDSLRGLINPYDMGNASSKIVEHLKNIPLTNIIKKKFHDINQWCKSDE
jgi:GDP/UDP-N,N'-diacetylbacillosamine 2-epimerase (hydrolysing)